MSVVFILGILTTAVFAVFFRITFKNYEKHDRVLFTFCQIRRDLMKELRARFDSISPQEYESAKFLLKNLNGVIQRYHTHKTIMFNLRKMKRIIEQDLKRYEEVRKQVQQQVQGQLTELPAESKIAVLYDDFNRAAMDAFLAYTPFIHTEVILRLLLGDIAGKIAKIRKEQKLSELSGEKFA